MKLFFSALVAGILLLTKVAPCSAQNNLKSIEVEGTLVNIGDYMVVLKDKKGTEYTAYLNEQDSTFNYRGTAEPKALSPGLMVRFTAKFDSNGNAQSELQELEIFTPRVGNRIPPQELLAQTPGIYPTEEAEADATNIKAPSGTPVKNNNKDKSKGTKGKDTNANKAKGPEFVEYRVVGQISAAQNGKLQIATGVRMLMVQLASNAKVNINSISPMYCVKDDQVKVEGLTTPDTPSTIQATKVVVTGAKPVGKSDIVHDKKSKGMASGKGNLSTDNKKPDDKKGADKKGSDKKINDKPGKPGSSN